MPIDVLSGRFAARLFDERLLPRWSIVLGMISTSLLLALVVLAASIADGTLQLPGTGRGLLNHYGFQVSFLAAPLVLLTTYYAVSLFLRILRDLEDLLAPGADISLVRAIVRPHINSIFLRSRWRGMLWLFMFIGIAISVAIFSRLDAPMTYWGNDVFNATNYRYGYLAGNLFFLGLWSLIYPIGFFYALHLTLSMEMIVARLKGKNLLRLNFLHIDNCGGMSKFGTLNFVVMLIYFWPALAVYAFHFTHQYTYLSLIAGAVVVSVILVAQSLYGIYWVYRTISNEKKQAVLLLNDQIVKALNSTRRNFAAAGATLQYRDHVISVNAFPYSRNVATAVNILRVAPTVLAVLRYLAP
jgi:hypothetical protein